MSAASEVVVTLFGLAPPTEGEAFPGALLLGCGPAGRGSSSSSSASAPSAAAPVRPNVEPPDELPAAAEEAELPVAERPDVDYKSVMVDGVKLDSNTPLRTLRGACESLGL